MGAASSSAAESSKSAQATTFDPEPGDIFLVRALFSKAFHLPPDVTDVIFDHAEYWAHSSNEIDFVTEHKSPLRISSGGEAEDRFLLRSFPVGLTRFNEDKTLSQELSYDHTVSKPAPLVAEHKPQFFAKLAPHATPKLANPVRKVVFTLRSKDQGWGGNAGSRGTYNKSNSWFEAGLERFEADKECESYCVADQRYESASSAPPDIPLCALRPVQPPVQRRDSEDTHPHPYQYEYSLGARERYKIQSNKVAVRNEQEHIVTWRWDDEIDLSEEEAAQVLRDQGRGEETGDGSFVRGLRLGDVITVWGKARYSGWANIVHFVKIDIYWAL